MCVPFSLPTPRPNFNILVILKYKQIYMSVCMCIRVFVHLSIYLYVQTHTRPCICLLKNGNWRRSRISVTVNPSLVVRKVVLESKIYNKRLFFLSEEPIKVPIPSLLWSTYTLKRTTVFQSFTKNNFFLFFFPANIFLCLRWVILKSRFWPWSYSGFVLYNSILCVLFCS